MSYNSSPEQVSKLKQDVAKYNKNYFQSLGLGGLFFPSPVSFGKKISYAIVPTHENWENSYLYLKDDGEKNAIKKFKTHLYFMYALWV